MNNAKKDIGIRHVMRLSLLGGEVISLVVLATLLLTCSLNDKDAGPTEKTKK